MIILAGGWLVIHEGASVGTVFVFATVLTQRFGMAAGSLGEAHVNLVGSLALWSSRAWRRCIPNSWERRARCTARLVALW